MQSINETGRGVTVSRVAYADAGITAPANGGSYGIKMTPLTSNPINYVAFYINIGRPVQPGMQVTFSFYIQVDSLADRYSVRHNDNRDTSVTDSTTINQWVTVTFTFVPKSSTQITENDNPNSIQFRVRFYDSAKDKTTINMYIDNLSVIDPA